MKAHEQLNAQANNVAILGVGPSISEMMNARGVYHAIFRGYKEEHKAEYLDAFPRLQHARDAFDRAIRGVVRVHDRTIAAMESRIAEMEQYFDSLTEVKRDCYAPNTVVTVGKNLALDTFLAGSAYTVTGPFMGLISSVSYSAISAADTMASHAGWTEAGATNAPTYTSPRKTISWSAASGGSKAPSSAPFYTFTGAGTIKGVFLAFGSGAVSTIDNTAGTLFSAGLFTLGDQAVVSTNTVTVTYSIAL